MIDVGEWRVGQTVKFFAGVEGDIGDAAGLPVARVKRAAKGQTGAPVGPIVATFTLVEVAEAGGLPAGWVVSLPHALTEQIGAGIYCFDIVTDLDGGDRDITPTYRFTLANSASAA